MEKMGSRIFGKIGIVTFVALLLCGVLSSVSAEDKGDDSRLSARPLGDGMETLASKFP